MSKENRKTPYFATLTFWHFYAEIVCFVCKIWTCWKDSNPVCIWGFPKTSLLLLIKESLASVTTTGHLSNVNRWQKSWKKLLFFSSYIGIITYAFFASVYLYPKLKHKLFLPAKLRWAFPVIFTKTIFYFHWKTFSMERHSSQLISRIYYEVVKSGVK